MHTLWFTLSPLPHYHFPPSCYTSLYKAVLCFTLSTLTLTSLSHPLLYCTNSCYAMKCIRLYVVAGWGRECKRRNKCVHKFCAFHGSACAHISWWWSFLCRPGTDYTHHKEVCFQKYHITIGNIHIVQEIVWPKVMRDKGNVMSCEVMWCCSTDINVWHLKGFETPNLCLVRSLF